MRPEPKPHNADYIIGPVRVVAAGDRRYRVLWSEGGKQRERTATTLQRAKDLARGEEARLAAVPGGLSTPDPLVAALVSVATDPARHQWTPRWAEEVERIARIHLIPALGTVTAKNFTKADAISILDFMAAKGYSSSIVEHCRRILAMAMNEGVERGLWAPRRHPLSGAKVPRGTAGNVSGRPDLGLVPTDEQVIALIEQMAADQPVYGAMAHVAAYTGIRWGELLALRASAVDIGRRRLTLDLNCVENGRTFYFASPGKANNPRPTRSVVLHSSTASLLEAWMRDYTPRPAAPNVTGQMYPDLLFQNLSNGNPFRRSAWTKVFWRSADKVKGWPSKATWHYLRHYCATWWLREGIEIPTVSAMLGHSKISTTLDWYVNTDEDSLNRAATVLG
jgi:integrase